MQFEECYKHLQSSSSDSQPTQNSQPCTQSRMAGLIQCNLDTDSKNEDDTDETLDPAKLWMGEFKRYLDTMDVVPDNMNIVRWWGVRQFCLQLECNANRSLAQCLMLPHMGFSRSRLPCHYGLLRFERMCIFLRWNYH